MPDHALLMRIDDEHRFATMRTREAVEIGPFTLLLDPTSDHIFFNYAVPTGAADDDEVARLVEAFEERGLSPRLEFCAASWPDLEASLHRAGFKTDCSLPQMACSPTTFRPKSPEGVESVLLNEGDDLKPQMEVANQAFEMELPIDEKRLAQARRALQNGWWIAGLASVEGQPAGCAIAVRHGGVCELCGVGTIPSFRRRGVASAVSSAVLQEHFKSGDLAWLCAGDDAARSVYEGLGFERVGTQIQASIADPSSSSLTNQG